MNKELPIKLKSINDKYFIEFKSKNYPISSREYDFLNMILNSGMSDKTIIKTRVEALINQKIS